MHRHSQPYLSSCTFLFYCECELHTPQEGKVIWLALSPQGGWSVLEGLNSLPRHIALRKFSSCIVPTPETITFSFMPCSLRTNSAGDWWDRYSLPCSSGGLCLSNCYLTVIGCVFPSIVRLKTTWKNEACSHSSPVRKPTHVDQFFYIRNSGGWPVDIQVSLNF